MAFGQTFRRALRKTVQLFTISHANTRLQGHLGFGRVQKLARRPVHPTAGRSAAMHGPYSGMSWQREWPLGSPTVAVFEALNIILLEILPTCNHLHWYRPALLAYA